MATRAPAPLPSGWLLKESVSNPFHFFYYNQFSGESTWSKPPDEVVAVHNDINENSTDSETAAKVGDKRSAGDQASKAIKPAKPLEDSSSSASSSSSSSSGPKRVRVYHILVKHLGSRNPSSWKSKKITRTKQEAINSIIEIRDTLSSVLEEGGVSELVETFKEFAKIDSDCSSYKRGGDLGYFERGKMQKEFEDASFELKVNELSNYVDSKSGIHVVLRIA